MIPANSFVRDDLVRSSRLEIAIAPDDYTASGKAPGYDAASDRWKTYLEAAGCSVKMVDVRSPDILSQLQGCDGFMWRWAHFGGMGRIARRLLPVVERSMGIPTYPDQATCWHYDDKIAQALLFEAHGIPTPRSWIFHDRDAALSWLREQPLPLVMKLATGAGSRNVVLLTSQDEAAELVRHVFGRHVRSLEPAGPLGLRGRARVFVRQVLQGRSVMERDTGCEPQAGYALFQEFLPDNDFDTRITVIGHRAFGFRRWNRTGDFRASGSGKVDYNISEIDLRFVRLGFLAAQRLGMKSCAIDGMFRRGEPVIGEVSYTYVSGNVHDCPGHWELDGDPETGTLRWVDGHMWPEAAQIEDFLPHLQTRRARISEISGRDMILSPHADHRTFAASATVAAE